MEERHRNKNRLNDQNSQNIEQHSEVGNGLTKTKTGRCVKICNKPILFCLFTFVIIFAIIIASVYMLSGFRFIPGNLVEFFSLRYYSITWDTLSHAFYFGLRADNLDENSWSRLRYELLTSGLR